MARLSCRENSATELRPLTLAEVEKHADGQIATNLITEEVGRKEKSVEKSLKPKKKIDRKAISAEMLISRKASEKSKSVKPICRTTNQSKFAN